MVRSFFGGLRDSGAQGDENADAARPPAGNTRHPWRIAYHTFDCLSQVMSAP